MPPAVSRLADRYGLDERAADRLARLGAMLADDPLAPTALRDPRGVLEDHLADSLVGLEVEALRTAGTVVDIGAGAGLPGLPLAIALPRAALVLVESNGRRCAFIERAAAACGVDNVRVVQSRIESWAEGVESSAVAVCRAVAPLEVVVEYGAPVLGIGGTLISWRGKRDLQAEERASKAAAMLGLEPREVRQVWPYPAARDRYLHLFSKVMSTPTRYPRRPGAALKRPLGADGHTLAT